MGWWDDVLSWNSKPEPERSEQVRKVLAMTTRELEEDLMSRKKLIVEFKKTDGPAPGRSEQAGRPFLLKMPMPVTVPPLGTRVVKLGVSCNLPVVVCRRGNDAQLFAPGQELEVKVQNADLTAPLQVGTNEVVAQCFVLDNTDLESIDG